MNHIECPNADHKYSKLEDCFAQYAWWFFGAYFDGPFREERTTRYAQEFENLYTVIKLIFAAEKPQIFAAQNENLIDLKLAKDEIFKKFNQ